MDKVYTNFLSRKGKENTLSCKISTLKKLLPFEEIDIDLNINITEIDREHIFISNTESKGFLVEKPSKSPKYDFCSLYKKIITSIGCIKELYNFNNEYFENIAELFTYDDESIGIGEWNNDFEKKILKSKLNPNIKPDELYTFAYEANGNRYLMSKAGNVFLYANDPNYRNIEVLDNCPKYTFYKFMDLSSINDLVKLFINDFISE